MAQRTTPRLAGSGLQICLGLLVVFCGCDSTLEVKSHVLDCHAGIDREAAARLRQQKTTSRGDLQRERGIVRGAPYFEFEFVYGYQYSLFNLIFTNIIARREWSKPRRLPHSLYKSTFPNKSNAEKEARIRMASSRSTSPRRHGQVVAAADTPVAATATSASITSADATSADAAATPAVTATATSKQTRASLSIHEKSIVKSFCEQRVEESKARGEVVPSQDLLRREVYAKFGWEMGRSTLSKIMTMDWKALSAGAHRNPNMKRKRKPLFPDFEADLVKYIGAHITHNEARAAAVAAVAAADLAIAESGISSGSGSNSAMMQTCGVGNSDEKPEMMMMASGSSNNKLVTLQGKRSFVLTEAVILEEAQRLKQVHGIKDEELVLSVGWLARFKHRNGIRLRKGVSSKQQQVLVSPSVSPPIGVPGSGFVNASLVSSSELLFGSVESGVSTAVSTAEAAAPSPSPSLLLLQQQQQQQQRAKADVDTAFAAGRGDNSGEEAPVTASSKGDDAARTSFFKAAKFAPNTARRRRASL